MRWSWLVVGAWVMVGCGDSTVEPPPPPASPPVVARVVPAGAACAGGGQLVQSGADGDGDGILDDDEVSISTPVCAGPGADPTLVRTRTEPAGAHCRGGGTAVESGPDRDRDGALDDGEVADTRYACDPSVLTALVAAGRDECPAGGLVIKAGRDRDGDGALDDDEVDHRDVQCGDVVRSGLQINTDDEARLLAGVRLVVGDLYIGGALHQDQLTEVSLPALERVDGRLFVTSAPNVARIAMPALGRIDGEVAITGAAHLTALEVPVLQLVQGRFLVAGDAALAAIRLPALIHADSLELTSDVALSTVEFPALGSSSLVRLLDLPGLTALTITASPGSVSVIGCPHLETLDLSTHWATTVTADDVPALRTVRVVYPPQPVSDFPTVGLTLGPAAEEVAIDGPGLDVLYVTAPVAPRLVLGPAGVGIRVNVLTIDAPITALPAVELAHDGALSLVRTRLSKIQLAVDLGGLSLADNPVLTGVHVGGATSVLAQDNPELVGIELDHPPLDGGFSGKRANITLSMNPKLEQAPWLGQVHVASAVSISRCPRLQVPDPWTLAIDEFSLHLADLPGLTTLEVEGIRLHRLRLENTGLTSLRVHSLGATPSPLSLQVFDNPRLASLQIDAETHLLSIVVIDRNPALRTLAVAITGAAQSVEIVDNAVLPACAAQAVLDRLVAPTERQSGNDEHGLCP